MRSGSQALHAVLAYHDLSPSWRAGLSGSESFPAAAAAAAADMASRSVLPVASPCRSSVPSRNAAVTA